MQDNTIASNEEKNMIVYLSASNFNLLLISFMSFKYLVFL